MRFSSGKALAVEGEGFTRQLLQAQAGHPAGGSLEGTLNQIRTNADRLKDLGAVVAGQQGNADLGEDLAQTVLQGLANVGLGLIRGPGPAACPIDQAFWVLGCSSQWRVVSQVSQGQTALAPYPIRQARWWVLQHWAVSTTREHCSRSP